MKLYEITNEYVSLLDELNDIEDLDKDAIENTLSPLSHDIKEKSINIAAWIKNLEAEAKAMGSYIKSMQARKKSVENKIAGVKDYLRYNMNFSGIKKITSAEFSISLGAESVSVKIVDENKIPIEFCRKVEYLEPDKELIKEAIQGGVDIPGAVIVYTKRLTIK